MKRPDWTEEIWAKWKWVEQTFDGVDWSSVDDSANYFYPRPFVDEWNRESPYEGFVYTARPSKGGQKTVWLTQWNPSIGEGPTT